MTQLYRPSNGTEGDWFWWRSCASCARVEAYLHGDAEPCLIFGLSMAVDVDDPDYPREWVCDDDGGNPRCSAWLAIGDVDTLQTTIRDSRQFELPLPGNHAPAA